MDLALQGQPWLAAVPLQPRSDVREAFEPQLGLRPHISQSGFDVTAALPDGARVSADTIINVTPYNLEGLPLAALHTFLRDESFTIEREPEPPEELR